MMKTVDVVVMLKEFGINCGFYSLYQSNEIRAEAFKNMAVGIDTWIMDFVNLVQGREGARMSFVGKEFKVKKFDSGYLDLICTSLAKVMSDDNYGMMYNKLLIEIFIFRGKLMRSGRIENI